MLGFDVDGHEASQLLQSLSAARATLPADDPRLLAGETEILQIFADLCALSRNRRVTDEADADEETAADADAARNPQEYFYAYLRSRDADTEGLPESFRIKLRRALAHYGVRRPRAVTRAGARPVPDIPGPPPRGRRMCRWCRSCCGGGCATRRRCPRTPATATGGSSTSS